MTWARWFNRQLGFWWSRFWSVSTAVGLWWMAEGFADVNALSSSSSHGGSKPAASSRGPAQKRKRRPSFAESVSDATALRAMLGKPKCHCKRGCLAQFSDDALFSKLLSFRSDWASLHKLDQDTEDAWWFCSDWYMFCFRWGTICSIKVTDCHCNHFLLSLNFISAHKPKLFEVFLHWRFLTNEAAMEAFPFSWDGIYTLYIKSSVSKSGKSIW